MKILITDDHALLRDSLALLLEANYGSSLSILQAENGHAALQQVEIFPDIDVILLDIDLPDIHGFQVIQTLKKRSINIPVIALSGIMTPQFIRQCMSIGATGFIPKTFSGKEMIAAIDMVLQGGSFIPREALTGWQKNRFEMASSPPVLTDRQLDVLRLIRKGLSNAEIASALQIKKTTVKTHVCGILSSLGVKNRTEAVNEALLFHLL